MDLYTQQRRNGRMTWLLMAGFVMLLVGLGFLFDTQMHWHLPLRFGSSPAVEMPMLPVFALGLSLVCSWYSYYEGDKVVLASMKARPLNEKELKERQLKNVVEEMAIAAGVPVPTVYLVPDDDLNAFATGRSPATASLAVTDGLLDSLDREELQAVVAHEMGHIRNLDIRTMMVVSVLLGTIALMCDMVLRSGRTQSLASRRSKSESGVNPLVIVAAILAPLAARAAAMAVSRTREFEADRSAAEFTRNPLALARALAKLEAAQAPTQFATQGTAHMFIVDPRVSQLNDREDMVGNLFATHPPVKARIKRLEAMGYGTLSEPAKTKSARKA